MIAKTIKISGSDLKKLFYVRCMQLTIEPATDKNLSTRMTKESFAEILKNFNDLP